MWVEAEIDQNSVLRFEWSGACNFFFVLLGVCCGLSDNSRGGKNIWDPLVILQVNLQVNSGNMP